MENKFLWQVLYTMPHFERKVFSEIENLQCEAYLPMVNVVRQWSDRKKKLVLPLFQNYVFVNMANVSPMNRSKIMRLPGVVRFLATNGRVDVVREYEIDTIRQVVDYRPQVTSEQFSVGDPVKFTAGPLKGIEGKLVNIQGKRKLLIHLTTIGKSLLIETSPDNVAVNFQMAEPQSV